jgi:hypothetical protein
MDIKLMENRTILGRVLVKAVLAGVILGFAPNAYEAWHFLSRAHTFEQVSIGLPVEATAKILLNNGVRCGISMHRGNDCWFSDFWRDYQIVVDPATGTVNRVAYINRRQY